MNHTDIILTSLPVAALSIAFTAAVACAYRLIVEADPDWGAIMLNVVAFFVAAPAGFLLFVVIVYACLKTEKASEQ